MAFYPGMGTLIKSNLKVYFGSIKQGASHYEALMACLKSRYIFEPNKLNEVELVWRNFVRVELLLNKIERLTEKEELRVLIHSITFVETHMDRLNAFNRFKVYEKLDEKFNQLYDSMKNTMDRN